MPGSPPISVADPVTRPPPSARSNSAMPVAMRGGSAISASSPTSATRCPPARRSWRREKGVTFVASSASVFHSAQSTHWPCHFVVLLPHAWQTYRFWSFATSFPARTKGEPRRNQAAFQGAHALPTLTLAADKYFASGQVILYYISSDCSGEWPTDRRMTYGRQTPPLAGRLKGPIAPTIASHPAEPGRDPRPGSLF